MILASMYYITKFVTYCNVIIGIFICRDSFSLLPNIVEQAIKDTNEYLASKNSPLLSQDVIDLIETQVLSIKEPDHKIKMLVGMVIIIL